MIYQLFLNKNQYSCKLNQCIFLIQISTWTCESSTSLCVFTLGLGPRNCLGTQKTHKTSVHRNQFSWLKLTKLVINFGKYFSSFCDNIFRDEVFTIGAKSSNSKTSTWIQHRTMFFDNRKGGNKIDIFIFANAWSVLKSYTSKLNTNTVLPILLTTIYVFCDWTYQKRETS